MTRIRIAIYLRHLASLFALFATSTAVLAGTISVDGYQTLPVQDGSAQSERVFVVSASEDPEASPAGAKIFVYPLLHDSPAAPPLSAAFGTLTEGTYDVSLRLRLLQAPSEMRLSWITDDPANHNGVNKTVVLSGLSPELWYDLRGVITVTGTWRGRPTLDFRSTEGDADRRFTVWIDELKLKRRGAPSSGCAADCFRVPLDFEADPLGEIPERMFFHVAAGLEVTIGVADHLPWQRLPDWFETERVQLHTRLRPRECLPPDPCANPPCVDLLDVDSDTFRKAADFAAAAGAGAWTRHVKWGNEGPWWPTTMPRPPPDPAAPCVVMAGDLAENLIDDAHLTGTRQIVYYWMMADDGVQNVKNWNAMTPEDPSTAIPSGRGDYITQNSPYPHLVEHRLRELVSTDRGADGVFFDEDHNPPDGDWSDWSKGDFAAFGFGTFPAARDHRDAAYHRLLDLYGLTLRDAFLRYHHAIHAENEEAIAVVSAGRFPALWRPQPRAEFVEAQQAVKGEWHKTWRQLREFFHGQLPPLYREEIEEAFHLPPRDVTAAVGFALMRDAANGRPPHIWVFEPTDIPSENTFMAWHFEQATAGILAHGGIANLNVFEKRFERFIDGAPPGTPTLPIDDPKTAGPYLSSLAFGDLVGPRLAGLRPHRWVGIHWNEFARQAIYELSGAAAPDLEEKYEWAWKEVLAPAVWAFATLQAHGVPASFVTDSQIARGDLGGYREGHTDGYDILFLPSDTLRPDVAQGLSTFGGCVIRNSAPTDCDDPPQPVTGPWGWHAEPTPGGGWTTTLRDDTATAFLEAISFEQGLVDGKVLDAPIEVALATDPEGHPVAPHIGAYTATDGSGRLIVALANRWDGMLPVPNDGSTVHVPVRAPEARNARVFLRRSVVSAGHTFRYARLEDCVPQSTLCQWHELPPPPSKYIFHNPNAPGGELVILKLGGNPADPEDDIVLRSGILIEAVSPAP